ncbi:hypothetical protein BDY19DRAFT_906536 [Irpex rosettiformis]|uniref:Uncharacterized protein n=1 Tax=Irpex rosettiformis TaxID=378272 RepID=A0ACB8U2C3_9APHY|nr:hypothetical protein BDY19DRAFT_906536 [Irpex rosettiformis]
MTFPYDPPPSPCAVKCKRAVDSAQEILPSIRRSRTADFGVSVFSSVPPGATFIDAGPYHESYMTSIELPRTYVLQPISTENSFSTSFSFKLNDLEPSCAAPEPPPTLIPSSQPSLSVSTNTSLSKLTQETHARAASQLQSRQDNSQTGRSYSRHVQNYEKFWDQEQQTRALIDSTWVKVLAFPITTTKAALFLNYEMTWPKLKPNQQVEPGATIGKYYIQQAISALEDWRVKNMHRYPHEQEILHPFRTDWRISQLESAAKNTEPQRVAKAQALKAVGGSADTYTTEEVLRCLLSFLTDRSTGRQRLFVSLRDRAMFLIVAQSAFRGESSRILLWSNCYQQVVPINDVCIGYTIPVLAMMSLNAKHNQHGRLDEHGVMRHLNVQVCAVGALAFLFWAMFHVMDFSSTEAELQPDFTATDCGPFGLHEWYSYYVFFGNNRKVKMTYDNHHDRIRASSGT